jgi:hypothetical protein
MTISLTTRSGVGRALTWAEGDANWSAIQGAVNGLLAASPGVGISSITQPTPTTLMIHLTDSTTATFTLPIASYAYRGTWAASTGYSVNDTFQQNGTLYAVIFAHTSASTFSAGANDGAGHDYYQVLLSTPSNVLPAGGTARQALAKIDGTDFNTAWTTLRELPTGGSDGQILTRVSGAPAWGAPSIDLAADVGATILPVANGGTGTATPGLVEGAGVSITGTWPDQTIAASAVNDAIQFVIDGGGATLTTGMKGYIEVPFACTLTRATLLADQSGSVVINIYKCTEAQFDAGATHPVSGDKITASAPPTISSATKSQDATLTGWTTSISAGDILAFNVDSATTIQRVTISLKVTR